MNTTDLTQRLDRSPEAGRSEGTSEATTLPAIDLQEYFRIMWRRKQLILSTAVAVLILGYLFVASLTPMYTASVQVEINPRQTQVMDFDAILSGLPGDVESIQTEIRIIQSRRIAQRSVTKLKLARDPEFNSGLRPAGLIASWRQRLAAWLSDLAGEGGTEDTEPEIATELQNGDNGFISTLLLSISRFLHMPSTLVGSAEQIIQSQNDSLIDAFLDKLTVKPEGRSRVVRISFESENPKTAAAAANGVADFYLVAQLEAKFEATKRATTWLGERVAQLRDEVEVKEQAIEDYRAVFGLLQGGREATLTDDKVSQLNTQYVIEQTNLAEAEARLRQVNRLLPNNLETAIEVLESPLIRDLRGEESRVERVIAELSEEYGERHPRLITARAELRDLRAKIKVEVNRVIQGLRNEVAIARARSASLKNSLEPVPTLRFLRSREQDPMT